MVSRKDSRSTAAPLPVALGRDDVMRYVLHEARGAVVGAGAVARMIRAREAGAEAEDRARTIRELDLILDALARLDAVLVRARPLWRGRARHVEAADLGALVARVLDGQAGVRLQAPRAPLPLATDAELVQVLVGELVRLLRGGGEPVEVVLRRARGRLTVSVAGAARTGATTEAGVALAIARAAAARVGAELTLSAVRLGRWRAQVAFPGRGGS